jgi:ribulose-phosphate 3-epimerase
MQVIPVINCLDFGDVQEKVARAEKFLAKGDWLHLDVSDGVFALGKSWRNPTQWANLRSKLNLEVHLMVEHPEHELDVWIAAGARRFIVHAETITSETARQIVARAKRRGIDVMLSSKPHTVIPHLWPFLPIFSHFQVLAVDPGPAGQKFIPIVLEKVRFLRNVAPNAMIEIDGGVNKEVAKRAKAAGANIIVSASYIFNNKNPKKAYKELKDI